MVAERKDKHTQSLQVALRHVLVRYAPVGRPFRVSQIVRFFPFCHVRLLYSALPSSLAASGVEASSPLDFWQQPPAGEERRARPCMPADFAVFDGAADDEHARARPWDLPLVPADHVMLGLHCPR